MLRAAASDERRRDIIAIALTLLDGMGGEASAIAIEDQSSMRHRLGLLILMYFATRSKPRIVTMRGLVSKVWEELEDLI